MLRSGLARARAKAAGGARVGLVALALVGVIATPAAAAVQWITGYYPAYRDLGPPEMHPGDFDYSILTHVIHWPLVPTNGTFDDPYGLDGQSAQVVSLAHAAGTKAILGFGGDVASVGTGWVDSTSPANRASFIAQMVARMQTRGYDGIDINWEGLTPADGPQFTAFITELRAALDAISPRPILTMAPTSGEDVPANLVAGVQQHFDQINIQTYVMSGPYPGWVTWFNSPIFNGGFTFIDDPATEVPSADNEVNRFVNAGIPVSKLAIGIQFDGAVWTGGSGMTNGGPTAPRQDVNDLDPPTMVFQRSADIIAAFTPGNGFTKTFDDVAKVPWIGRDDAADANDTFISFDDEQAIQEKATYIGQKGLAGVFVFELSGDFFPLAAGNARHPLLTALKNAFPRPQTPPPSGSGAFFTVTPCRVADTRGPAGPSGGPALAANATRSFAVVGLCGIPGDATAVAINVTVVEETGVGDLRLYAAGGAVPSASTINFSTNHVRANNAIIPLGAGGQIAVQCDMPAGSTHFLFDVTGYFK
jgi:chitinase